MQMTNDIPPGWRPANHCETVKRCTMCHEVYSLDGWMGLERKGSMETGDPNGPPLLDLRNCPKCLSTIAMNMSVDMTPLIELRRS